MLLGFVKQFYLLNTFISASTSTLKDVESFLEECRKMKHLDHPNVLSLIGVSFDEENNPAMILPFMGNGDVKSYLISQRVSENDVDTFPLVMYNQCSMHYMWVVLNTKHNTSTNLYYFTLQIGCLYLVAQINGS